MSEKNADNTWIDAPPEYRGPNPIEAWTCMRCGYPHQITAADKARGVIDQDRCHCGENFYAN